MNIEKLIELSNRGPVLGDNLHGRDGSNPYYDFLAYLASEMEAKAILELGTDKGDSACRFAYGAPFARVATVDIACSETIMERASKFPNIKVWTDNTNDLSLPYRLLQEYGPFDILLIDTEHSYNQAKGEFINYGPLVREGGVILFDDIHLHEGMSQFWAEVPVPKVELNHLHWTGFGAYIKGA